MQVSEGYRGARQVKFLSYNLKCALVHRVFNIIIIVIIFVISIIAVISSLLPRVIMIINIMIAIIIIFVITIIAVITSLLPRVIKIVAPKKAKLSEAETELANQMDKLNEKRAQLQQV